MSRSIAPRPSLRAAPTPSRVTATYQPDEYVLDGVDGQPDGYAASK